MAADPAKVLRDVAYVGVGFGVLTFQRAQVRRRELARELGQLAEEARAGAGQLGARLEAGRGEVERRLGAALHGQGQRASPNG